jgi:hypothetical protein
VGSNGKKIGRIILENNSKYKVNKNGRIVG